MTIFPLATIYGYMKQMNSKAKNSFERYSVSTLGLQDTWSAFPHELYLAKSE
jgi:hypothetical protein